MKATDLMIGDWIKGESNIVARVIEIKEYLIRIDAGIGRGVFEPKELFPIPITSEILEKNGFKPQIPENHIETVYACQDVSKAVADELYALWPYRDGSFYLLLRVDGKDMVRMDVHYIHQLQHALRLCGISHEII